jgi:hypothetical protein
MICFGGARTPSERTTSFRRWATRKSLRTSEVLSQAYYRARISELRSTREHPLSADGIVDLTSLKEAVSASQLGRAPRAIVAESEHRAARDAPVPLCFDPVQPTGSQ